MQGKHSVFFFKTTKNAILVSVNIMAKNIEIFSQMFRKGHWVIYGKT